jgi:Starch-binding associating with outer membrane
MSLNRRIIITAVAGLVLGVSSCKKFLDVNNNPNQSPTATVQTLLPAAELYVASTVGVDLQINGCIWGEFWTQSPNASQYRQLEQYAPGQDNFSTPWTNLYVAGENFYQLYYLADTQHKKQYKAISLAMQAYTFQLLTDAWGDVPFKQALKGAFADSNIINPKYDSQRVVYRGIQAYLDSALKLINPSDKVVPTNDDLIYGGDMKKWRKFCYTLKLRSYLRMSQIDPIGAKAGVIALYADPNLTFIGSGDDAFIAFGASSSSKSPLYAEASSTTMGGIQNLVGSKTCIDQMNNNGDPRAYVFYEGTAASGGGAVVGVAQGDYATTALASTYSLPNVYVAGDANNTASANAPVNLLTSYESLFLQAEVVARGWVASSFGQTDDVLFYAGIKANFDYYKTGLGLTYGAPATSTIYNDYIVGYILGGTTASPLPGPYVVYPVAGTVAQKVEFIITQKWFSMCGNQGFEAWCEQRRTGYPNFFVLSKNSLIGPNYPKRFLYPTSESTRNVNFPGLKTITTKMWWDLF